MPKLPVERQLKSHRYLPEIHFIASLSRGPGGQNVNKVSSAAQLRWPIASSRLLTEEQKSLIFAKLSSHLTKEGELYLRSDESRDLERNKALCLEKLDRLLERAFHKPKPRKKTKPTRASKERRQESKRQRSQTKQTRQKVSW